MENNNQKTTEIKLTTNEKADLQLTYGYYKSLKRKDFDSIEEFNEELANERKDFVKNHPKLAELISKEYQCDIEKSIEYLFYMIYSNNQYQFIEDAEEQGLEIDYSYSGRGMFGDVCPSVTCESHNDLKTKANTLIDSMGLGIVIYAKN